MPRLNEPLVFRPLFRDYLWGGRRLQTVLGKNLPDESEMPRVAESWEIVDHGDDQSVVVAGPWKDVPLGRLVREHGEDLCGQEALAQFPLLLKFLDAQDNLSVQVHPDDERAAQLDPPDLGKTEAWYILHAEPETRLYAGLKRGMDRNAFEREVHRGTAHLCLHTVEPQAGDCFFIPAGTVHALGAGLVVAEIQQASDTTYRLYDWNRVGPDGKGRQLHLEQGLDAIDYERGPVDPQMPAVLDSRRSRLVSCDKFVLDHIRFGASESNEPDEPPVWIGGDARFHMLAAVRGRAELHTEQGVWELQRGDSLLLPAAAGRCRLEAHEEASLLLAGPPIQSDEQ